jgi:ribosome maturation factor RimP
MDKDAADTLYGELSPVVGALGLELVDVESAAATIRVTVERDGGVDLDALAAANRAVSSALDRIDPLPGRYTLEVSSPGLERRLRTPGHFARAVGETVTVRVLPGTAAERRLHGRLVTADADGIVVEGPEVPGGSASLGYAQIERARTVFEWGSPPAPRGARRTAARTAPRDAAGGGDRVAHEKARTP